jgi:inorganic pyrophosphatase
VVAVARDSHRYGECRELRDIAGNVLNEVEQFFVVYNAHKGGRFRPLARRGAAVAAKLVRRGEGRRAAAVQA